MIGMEHVNQTISDGGMAGALSLGIPAIAVILGLIALIVNIAFAAAVYHDAAHRVEAYDHLWFVSPILWAAATLVGSVFVAAVYWLMHYSRLAPPNTPPYTDETPPRPPRDHDSM